MQAKIARKVVHHARHDPTGRVGGVHTFALGLRDIFEEVEFTHTGSARIAEVAREGLPVICDNQTVLDWPDGFPLIGFRHGVAAEKVFHTRSYLDLKLALGQLRAGRRKNTLWVACANWIAAASERLYRSATQHIIYHPIDISRFDGRDRAPEPRLVLHDARGRHKGEHLVAYLASQFPDFRFEGLECAPEDVPARLRSGHAFIHLSRYEGNSIVCNEAMSMNLPCLFTRVGLMRDADLALDVWSLDAARAFRDRSYLKGEAGAFLRSLSTRNYAPRAWITENATPEEARRRWQGVLADWEGLSRAAASRE